MRVPQLGGDVEAELVTILNGGITQPDAFHTCSTNMFSHIQRLATQQVTPLAEHAATDPSNVFPTHMHIATNGGDRELPETAGSSVTSHCRYNG